ncbi:MAG: VWA domain-containing protein [Gemmatimonadales bacterium]|nr:VWA domain-containing protein [Gemmatimonadales bacterium]
MRYTTYARYLEGLAGQVNLQSLLDQLGDFLLQSGFDGVPWWGDPGDADNGRTVEDLREAILRALMESGQLTPEMLQLLSEGSTGDEERDAAVTRDLAELLDRIVGRLVDEGYLSIPASQSAGGPGTIRDAGGTARDAARTVRFDVSEKGADFLGYRSLKALLGALGRSAVGAHETSDLSTGIEAEAASRPFEFGDVLNLDVAATLTNAISRHGLAFPLELDHRDLMVTQSAYRSSAATVLMLDCSHSMILYGEDRFTPAKRVALALTHLIRTHFPGDSIRVVLFHDGAQEIPLGALANVQVGPYHTNTAGGLALARRILASQRQEMQQIIMITDGKPTALTMPDGRTYINSGGPDPAILKATYREVSACRRSGIMINTFMLAREAQLVEFVKQVSRICRGKAYFANPVTLGEFLLMDFLKGKTSRG